MSKVPCLGKLDKWQAEINSRTGIMAGVEAVTSDISRRVRLDSRRSSTGAQIAICCKKKKLTNLYVSVSFFPCVQWSRKYGILKPQNDYGHSVYVVSDTCNTVDVCCSVAFFTDTIEQSSDVHATITRRELRPVKNYKCIYIYICSRHTQQ